MHLFESCRGDVMVLARYMQILAGVVRALFWTHYQYSSLIPAVLIGAKPHHQAYERGVKLIGEPVTMPLQNSMTDD